MLVSLSKVDEVSDINFRCVPAVYFHQACVAIETAGICCRKWKVYACVNWLDWE